eukprot:CAMPEP_0119101556 /NCGR_PEP_ID=MMETSP1180-20130426/588_1 /TAXON_ID=3052 ORGANISM="Chlamydomonas cf sp, Strain CCMP681" /NCGR_SAMPLE_ID=MMETSP1180 /ASSEMBLY_ACC=CAM_ASM_000741 /LENGTH=80 /DNA_ID=CAMNT_0007085697 /DNA_START=201 /DNA_END=443 /DNA_ORIENTATION=+
MIFMPSVRSRSRRIPKQLDLAPRYPGRGGHGFNADHTPWPPNRHRVHGVVVAGGTLQICNKLIIHIHLVVGRGRRGHLIG